MNNTLAQEIEPQDIERYDERHPNIHGAYEHSTHHESPQAKSTSTGSELIEY